MTRQITQVFADQYNAVVGALITAFTVVFGVHWYIFAAYMLLNVLDWLTGWYNARQHKEESSKVGLIGIIKKLGYWAIILVAFTVSNVFVKLGSEVLELNLSFLKLIGWYTLALLMINEARSIIENLVELGYRVPEMLVKGLAVTEKLVSKEESDNEKDK